MEVSTEGVVQDGPAGKAVPALMCGEGDADSGEGESLDMACEGMRKVVSSRRLCSNEKWCISLFHKG